MSKYKMLDSGESFSIIKHQNTNSIFFKPSNRITYIFYLINVKLVSKMWSYLKDFVSQWKIKMKSNADGKSIFVNRFV